MANGMDQGMSRREFIAGRLGDLGLAALVVAAGPIFGRMLNSLYVQDSGPGHRMPSAAPTASPVRRDTPRGRTGSKGADV